MQLSNAESGSCQQVLELPKVSAPQQPTMSDQFERARGERLQLLGKTVFPVGLPWLRKSESLAHAWDVISGHRCGGNGGQKRDP